MPGYLRQSTASQSRALGPFVDDTDFKTVKTGLTIANTDIKLVVNGGASANKNSGGGTHRVNGVYGVTFDATDTATVGEMEVSVVVAGALPVFDKFFILEEVIYDALFAAAATGALPVSTGGIAEAAFAADSAKYQAKIWFTDDEANTTDRYVVAWFKNSEPKYTGITVPTIQIVKESDGSNLVASTAMTQIGATGVYKYEEIANRIANGAGYFALVTATIDGSTRFWTQPISRDG